MGTYSRYLNADDWWKCGDSGYHDLNQFDLVSETCTVCGMELEDYWQGYADAIGDSQDYINAKRTRRTTSRSRSLAAMHIKESENSGSSKRPERAYILMGVGE